MTAYVPATLIKELEEALTNSVPARRHNDVLAALKRCQELIGRLATTIVDLDREQKHGDLMFEAKLYANVLTGFFEGPGGEWFDLSKGYNPRDYLASKGVIKPDEIRRPLSELEWKLAQQKLKRAQRSVAEVVVPVKPKAKRGRPTGSRNKLKTGGRK